MFVVRILMPVVEYRREGSRLAPRPATLDGKVVAFLDGWGERKEDGGFDLYPLMRALRERLEARFRLQGTFWRKKPNISQPVPAEMIDELVREADVVINGECA